MYKNLKIWVKVKYDGKVWKGELKMQKDLNMEIPGEAQYIRTARLAVSGLASKMSFSEEEIEDIKISLSEACNAILDNGWNLKKSIHINFKPSIDGLCIEVKSSGNELSENIWEKKHMLGKRFVETLMDDVTYQKDSLYGSSVRMYKYIHNIANDSLKYKH